MHPSPARFLFLLYFLLVLWRGIEATPSASSSLECSLPGFCLDFLLDVYSSTSLDNCTLFGRSIPGATWVSFNRELGACSAFQACDNLDESDVNTVSSSVNCTPCSVSGTCQGYLLAPVDVAESAEDCLNLCQAEKDCAWFSFNSELKFCYLFQSCSDLLVDGHEDWVSGEVACSSTPAPSSTTTATPAPTTTSTPAPEEDQEIVWINHSNGEARLVNLNTTRVCSLPSYPGVDGHGPVVLTYLENQRLLVACGSSDRDDKSCYQLSPDNPSEWEPLPSLTNTFCPNPRYIRNVQLPTGEWLLLGQKDHCGGGGADISSELLNYQWSQPRITNPYSAGYPAKTCTVAINTTRIIVTGGGGNGDASGWLSSTWMLDLTDSTWERLQDMPGPKRGHGCTTTPGGELIIAGGSDGSGVISSVYSYNLMSNTWKQMSDLPREMKHIFPVMFFWNKHPIILESPSSNIWILDGNNWKKMEANLGATFNGARDVATTIPPGALTC